MWCCSLFSPPASFILFVVFAFARSDEKRKVVLIKVGGSSITDKSKPETLDRLSLKWFSRTLALGSVDQDFIVVHGAGSFGHFVAKEYGLGGQTDEPPSSLCTMADNDADECTSDDSVCSDEAQMERKRQGLSLTRASVQKLNHAVVESMIQEGIPAVGISPCFSIPGVQAHGGDSQAKELFQSTVLATLKGGFVPVIHGDACMYGKNDMGILSGDTIMKILGTTPWVSRSIFLTDVDGIFTADPRVDSSATHIPQLYVGHNGELVGRDVVDASGSRHTHDVTGGFKTKLDAAISIAAAGKVVSIAKCSSAGAEAAVRSEERHRSHLVSLLVPKDV